MTQWYITVFRPNEGHSTIFSFVISDTPLSAKHTLCHSLRFLVTIVDPASDNPFILLLSMAGYKSVPKHNICAHLDLTTSNAKHYSEIITFLRRSRIFTAISTVHVPYLSHQQDFWSSADIDCEAEPTVIRGKVRGQDVVVSAEHIRRICGFQDSQDQPALLDRFLVRGCFLRCKYEGDIGAGILNKAFMSPQFKYLAHVLVHCLGSRRGGFDDMRETI
ncbi:hypothetical protein R6Q59_029394 [Mikania micrantha]